MKTKKQTEKFKMARHNIVRFIETEIVGKIYETKFISRVKIWNYQPMHFHEFSKEFMRIFSNEFISTFIIYISSGLFLPSSWRKSNISRYKNNYSLFISILISSFLFSYQFYFFYVLVLVYFFFFLKVCSIANNTENPLDITYKQCTHIHTRYEPQMVWMKTNQMYPNNCLILYL